MGEQHPGGEVVYEENYTDCCWTYPSIPEWKLTANKRARQLGWDSAYSIIHRCNSPGRVDLSGFWLVSYAADMHCHNCDERMPNEIEQLYQFMAKM